jgi:choice-of-anchor A domain-containing protein
MKKISTAVAVATLCVGITSFADGSTSGSAANLGIYDFAAYTSTTIHTENSDFMGRVGAALLVNMTDFSVIAPDTSTCALFARQNVTYNHGEVKDMENGREVYGCTETHTYHTAPAFWTGGEELPWINNIRTGAPTLQFKKLNAEIQSESTYYATTAAQTYGSTAVKNCHFKATKEINVFSMNTSDLLSCGSLLFEGDASSVFIVNISGASAILRGKGFGSIGNVSVNKILLNFVDATSVVISNAGADPFGSDFVRSDAEMAPIIAKFKGAILKQGMDSNETASALTDFAKVGIPATIIAPAAMVEFNDARVTGAIYARAIEGIQGAYGDHSGQINPGCFEGGSTGHGCGSTPVPTPDQRQQPIPDQQQNQQPMGQDQQQNQQPMNQDQQQAQSGQKHSA